jgi:hypothetical protein
MGIAGVLLYTVLTQVGWSILEFVVSSTESSVDTSPIGMYTMGASAGECMSEWEIIRSQDC